MMTEMKLPACYAVIDENEMTYLDGGAAIADSDAYKAFLNVGQVFNQLARIFSGASSIINNINVVRIYMFRMNYRRNTYFRNTLNIHTLSFFGDKYTSI